MLNVGIIGVGGMGGVHLGGWSKLDSARVVALCDKIPERASGKGSGVQINLGGGGAISVDAKPYTNYHDLLADSSVDVVDICLPTDLHAEVAMAALKAGKHVLCEKPMARNVAQCDEMIATAAQTGKTLMIAQVIRMWPEYMVLADLVNSGTYGKVTSANFTRLSILPTWSVDNWLLTPARSGGALLDLHVHDIDFVQSLLGMPSGVRARGVQTPEGISHLVTEFVYGDNQMISAEGGWYYPPAFPFRMGFLVRMEGATVEWQLSSPLTVYPADGEAFTPDVPQHDGYAQEIAYFADCVTRGVTPAKFPLAETRDSIRLAEAAEQSVRSGLPVSL